MKPLSQINLNKHSIVSNREQGEKLKAKRPGLELLNILNDKIVEENHVAQFKMEMQKLKEENSQLKKANVEIMKQLQVEKRLRKIWNKEDIILYDDLEGLKKQLKQMKFKYQHYK